MLSRRVGSAPNLGCLGQLERASDLSPRVVSLAPVGDSMRFESGADPVAWDFSTQECDKRWDPQAAFWMMWFSLRAFTADQPQTQAELIDVGCEDLRCITVPGTGLQALVARCPDGGAVLSFRGTTDLYGWCTDLNFRLSPFSQSMPESISDNISERISEDLPEAMAKTMTEDMTEDMPGKVHLGFREALDSGWPEIMSALKSVSKDFQSPIWVTGHSLGGALATLAAVRLKSEGLPVAPLYTFGAPPVGDEAFCALVDRCFPNAYYRVAIDEDIVPRALVDNVTWNDVNPKMPILLKPVAAAMQQFIHSAKFSQGGRLVEIKTPETQAPGARFSPACCEASRHDVRRFWQGLQKQNVDVWTALMRQDACHNNQAYLASLSKAVKPSGVQP